MRSLRTPKLSIRWCFILIAPFYFTLFMASDVAAAPEPCQLDMPPVSVEYNSYESEVEINRGHSSSQLANKLDAHSKHGRKAGVIYSGLTESQLKYRTQFVLNYLKVKNNLYCFGLQSISLRVGYPKITIYIARSMKPNSCVYRSTMSHERQHVTIYLDQLRKFNQLFENRLEDIVLNLRPVLLSSEKSANSYFLNWVKNELESLYDQLRQETSVLQNRLDTPENYRRLQALCPQRRRTRR